MLRKNLVWPVIGYYLVTFVAMSYYGGKVCNFICTLDPWEWARIVGVGLLGGFILRTLLTICWVERRELITRSRWQYAADLVCFGIAGLGVTLYDFGVHNFPIGSGMKGLLGFLTFGFFAAADLSLAREYDTALYCRKNGLRIERGSYFFSLPKKFAFFAISCSTLVGGVVALLLLRDLEVILPQQEATMGVADAQKYVLHDIFTVLGILVVLLSSLAVSYARNLRFFFGLQSSALNEVTAGRLDTCVPVSSADEFGVIASQTNVMIDCLRERTESLEATQDATIVALAGLAEQRDNETGMHIRRTQSYIELMARYLHEKPEYAEALPEGKIRLLQKSAPLHDIGKVGIPDAILLKPGKLTAAEFEVMKQHPKLGADTLKIAQKDLGDDSFLRLAYEIALTHHEKWDGTGYPQGLEGEQIPLSGRLMAVADVYDALISRRCYKEPFSHEQAAEIILQGRGKHFDPVLVDAFNELQDEFAAIAQRLSDKPEN